MKKDKVQPTEEAVSVAPSEAPKARTCDHDTLAREAGSGAAVICPFCSTIVPIV